MVGWLNVVFNIMLVVFCLIFVRVFNVLWFLGIMLLCFLIKLWYVLMIFFVLLLKSLMVLMYFFKFFMFKVKIVLGVLVMGKSLFVVLFMFLFVVWVERMIVINNLKGEE